MKFRAGSQWIPAVSSPKTAGFRTLRTRCSRLPLRIPGSPSPHRGRQAGGSHNHLMPCFFEPFAFLRLRPSTSSGQAQAGSSAFCLAGRGTRLCTCPAEAERKTGFVGWACGMGKLGNSLPNDRRRFCPGFFDSKKPFVPFGGYSRESLTAGGTVPSGEAHRLPAEFRLGADIFWWLAANRQPRA